MKKNAWEEVTKPLNIEVHKAQNRYNTVRTSFGKYIKNLKGKKKPVQLVLGGLEHHYEYSVLKGINDFEWSMPQEAQATQWHPFQSQKTLGFHGTHPRVGNHR